SSAGREQPREGRPTNTEREGGHVGPPVHKVGADLCVGPMPMCLSEQELQTELNVPLAWTPAPRVAFACDPTERSARGIGLRVVEVDEVWEVERLAAQLNPLAVRRAERLEQRDVPVLRVRTADRVASRVSERTRGRTRERGGIEPEHLIGAGALRE